MSVPTRGQGPLNDPRMVERRGDLSGLNALLFLLLVVAAFAVAAFVLYSFVKGGPAAPVTTASPSPVRSLSLTPSPSLVASVAPSPSGSVAPPPVSAPLGTAASLVQNGVEVGTVSVKSVAYKTSVAGHAAPAGTRWLVATIRYDATATLSYDAASWDAIGGTSKRVSWAGRDLAPALGKGTLHAGQSRTGNVTFQVPAKPLATDVILTDSTGTDVVDFSLPSPGQ